MISKSPKTRKRKSQEAFPLNELNQDLLEKVLSRIPPSRFFSLRSVSKSWNSIANSASFRLACSEVRSREPWFLMIGQELDQSIVFDTSQSTWKKLNHHPTSLHQTQSPKSVPVASTSGLVCFRNTKGQFLVSNLLTNACREIPSLQTNETHTVQAIAMNSSSTSYKIVVLLGEYPNLSVTTFNSMENKWENQVMLRKTCSIAPDQDEPETLYFLSKAGEVVSTTMQRSSSKQYSSVLTVENGEEIVYFLGHLGNVVACNLARKCFNEYPRILPIHYEYSIDLVECNGHMFVVILHDFLDSSSLNIWKFLKEEKTWQQVAAMPPYMSHDFFGKKVDINCAGYGDLVLICMNSYEMNRYVMCNVSMNDWVELPKCFSNGREEEFMSALSFEPRIEVSL